jgi:hypothetical protein
MKIEPEAATAVIELLMMGGKTSETCWAVNKSQDNKLKNCCIWLVIYLNCAMMHGLTNLKFIRISVYLFVYLQFNSRLVYIILSCGIVIDFEFVSMWKEVFVWYLKAVFHDFPYGTNVHYENPQSEYPKRVCAC